MQRALSMIGLVSVVTVAPANAGYVLSITGPPEQNVQSGRQFQLSAVLTSDANDRHDSMIFDVRFSGPVDLVYRRYFLDPVAYQTGGADDFSVPEWDPNIDYYPTYTICASRPCVSDYTQIHFEAVTRPGQTFGSGTLVTMSFKVPVGTPELWSEPYTVEVIPDTFARGFEVVETVSGGPFLFFVDVPEPGTLALLVLGGVWMARQRSRNSPPPPLRSRH